MIHLDTSFVIDLLREQSRQRPGPATACIEAHSADELGASVFVVCELEAGAARASNPIAMRSSAVSFSTTGFISADHTPFRVPTRMSYSWRTSDLGDLRG